MPLAQDLTGQKFGLLTVTRLATQNGWRRQWECLCECGCTTLANPSDLKRHDKRQKRSCGCLYAVAARNRKPKHGMYGTPTYICWKTMRARCNYSGDIGFANYGGRGITICERWNEFKNFLEDMGERPGKKMTVERKDTNGNYCKENCLWATYKTQERNRRNNRRITFNGQTKCLEEWANEIGVTHGTLSDRLKRGWSLDEAFTKSPLGHHRNKRSNVMLTINGVTKCVTEWAEETGVPRHVICRRIKTGWSAENAAKTPQLRPGRIRPDEMEAIKH